MAGGSSTAQRLAHDVADKGPGRALAAELAGWLAGSSRFTAFVEAHRSKIRKKLRGAADEGAVHDIRAELAFARLVLADRRFEVAFEPHGRSGGPDFTLTYRAGRPFSVEVTRLRREPDVAAVGGVVLGKLRQLPPSVSNLLVIAVESQAAGSVDVGGAIRVLRDRADAKDDAWFAFRGVDGTRVFWDRFQRLGGVVVWSETVPDRQRVASWANGSARIAVPEPAMRAVLARLRT
jgi:hypothetical protein